MERADMAAFENGTTYEQSCVSLVDGRTIDAYRTHYWIEGAAVLTNPALNHLVRLAKRAQGVTVTLTAEGDAALSSYRLTLPVGQTFEQDAPVIFEFLALHGMSGDARIAYHRALSSDAAMLRRVKKVLASF